MGFGTIVVVIIVLGILAVAAVYIGLAATKTRKWWPPFAKFEEVKEETEEEKAKRLAKEEAKRLAEEAKRLAKEEAKRLAEEEAKRLADEETARLALAAQAAADKAAQDAVVAQAVADQAATAANVAAPPPAQIAPAPAPAAQNYFYLQSSAIYEDAGKMCKSSKGRPALFREAEKAKVNYKNPVWFGGKKSATYIEGEGLKEVKTPLKTKLRVACVGPELPEVAQTSKQYALI